MTVDDGMPDHPKFSGPDWASLLALHVTASCFCSRYLTDGFLRASIVPDLVRRLPERDWCAVMVEAGLWEEAPGGYFVHDYFAYNPTKEQVLAERKAATERQQAHRARQAEPASQPSVTPSPVPAKKPSALYLLYEQVKHDLWGRAGKPADRGTERRDYDGLKSLRAVWRDPEIITAAKELRRQIDAGEVAGETWQPGSRFGAIAMRTKFDAGTWWMDKLLADARRRDERSPRKPALKTLGDAMRKVGL